MAGQALVTSSEDGPDDSGQEGGLESAGEGRFPTVPSILPAPLPASILAISPGIHGDRRGGGGICWSGGRDASLDSRPGAASSARCPLPAAHSRASLSSAGALGAACVVAEPT